MATFAATAPPAVAAAEWRAQRLDRAESGRAASGHACLSGLSPRPPCIYCGPAGGWGRGQGRTQTTSCWATCFFGIFRAGELTVQSQTAFDPRVHLAWGDVTCEGGQHPSWVRIFLKRSKTSRSVAVYVGATGDNLCPVTALLEYVAARGETPGPFFRFVDGTPLTKVRFVSRQVGGVGIKVLLQQPINVGYKRPK